jgi:pantothenate kinase-related protein Tda10
MYSSHGELSSSNSSLSDHPLLHMSMPGSMADIVIPLETPIKPTVDATLYPHKPFFVAVGGGSSSGKTEVCKRVMNLLKINNDHHEKSKKGTVSLSISSYSYL